MSNSNIDWSKIRVHKHSQQKAFEELVCQLALNDRPTSASKFYRVEAPDGGVEAYWQLSDGNEIGWQAKYHLDKFDTGQWSQIEKSFKRAFDTHPALTDYYIALPIDFEDPRIKAKKSKQDKWNENTAKWRQYAESKGRKVEFHFWGAFQLGELLTKKENEGKRFYWFNEAEYTDQWFESYLKEAIEYLGSRYTPDLNLELPIAKAFNGIYHGIAYKNDLDKLFHEFLVKANGVINRTPDKECKNDLILIAESVKDIRTFYSDILFDRIINIDQAKWNLSLRNVALGCDRIVSKLDELDKIDKDEKIKNGLIKADDIYYRYYTHLFGYEKRNVNDFSKAVRELDDFINETTTDAFNKPFMLLKGEKGIGKSHLLADIAVKKQAEGCKSILLLGQHFTNGDPWLQLLTKLGVSSNKDIFLSTLDAKAQSIQSRIVIIIDAINEGAGISLWPDYFSGFTKTIENYPWLGLIVSIRTPYEKLIFEEQFIKDNFVEIVHYGFDEQEYEAAKFFFKNAGIEQPKVPLLYPEFRQPLFLKLFCDGLKKANKSSIPKEGYDGISEITGFLMAAINQEIAKPARLNFSPSLNIAEQAISIFISSLIDTGTTVMLYDYAHKLLESSLTQYRLKPGILEQLIAEGLLAKTLFWKNGKYLEGVYFTFQRYEDHFRAKFLLEKYYDPSDPAKAFKKDEAIGRLFAETHQAHTNSRLLEALAIQIPEVTGKELFDFFSDMSSYGYFIHAVIDSLQWRKHQTVNERVIKYILKYCGNEDIFKRFLDVVILASGKPGHYLNADFLHNWLSKLSMPKRDSVWTVFINKHYRHHNSVKRIVDWSWSDDDKLHIDMEAVLLVSITLSWFLTSSNRNLRDASTKAITSILRDRLDVALSLIIKFQKINDPGVIERIVAAVYGAVLLSTDTNGLNELAQSVYDLFFKPRYVRPHILLRDYARNIVEYAVQKDCVLNYKPDRIRPPYRSVWYKQIPTTTQIKKMSFDYKAPGFKDYYWSQNSILDAVYEGSEDFDKEAVNRIARNWKISHDEVCRILVDQTFKMGYNVELHGKYDRNVSDYFSKDQCIETIGKKYLWHAVYQLAAKACDNKKFKSDYGSNYQGPWEPYLRDIDPSIMIAKTQEERYPDESEQRSWHSSSYNNWLGDDKTWIHTQRDIPDPCNLINMSDPDGYEWLQLDCQLRWDSPVAIGVEKYHQPRQNLLIDIQSYLVAQKDKNDAIKYLSNDKQMHYFGNRNGSVYEVFSREYFWSPAYRDHFGDEQTHLSIRYKDNRVIDCIYTTAHFVWEQSLDHSKEMPIRYMKPCKTLFDGLGMSNGREGEYLDGRNELICFDPSVYRPVPSCLLIRKDALLEFLQESGQSLVWRLSGEKRLLGRDYNPKEKRYWGENNFSGVFVLNGNQIDGSFKHKIEERT